MAKEYRGSQRNNREAYTALVPEAEMGGVVPPQAVELEEAVLGALMLESESVTIVQEYQEGRMPFYHFDVYRISDIDEMDDIGYEDYIYGDGVCFIEWANLIEEILPEERITITIEKNLEKGFDYRKIIIE